MADEPKPQADAVAEPLPAAAPADHPAIAEVEAWFRLQFSGPRISQDLWNEFYTSKEALVARLRALL